MITTSTAPENPGKIKVTSASTSQGKGEETSITKGEAVVKKRSVSKEDKTAKGGKRSTKERSESITPPAFTKTKEWKNKEKRLVKALKEQRAPNVTAKDTQYSKPECPYLAWVPTSEDQPGGERWLKCLLCNKWCQDDSSRTGTIDVPYGSK